MKWEKGKKRRTRKNNSKKKWPAEAGVQKGNQSLDAWPKAVKIRITKTAMRRMQFGQNVRVDPYCGFHWVSNLGIRSHFLARILSKAVLEGPNRSGHRCQRPAFQSLFIPLTSGQVIWHLYMIAWLSLAYSFYKAVLGMKWSDTKAGAVSMDPNTSSNGEFPKLRYFLPPQLSQKWKSDGTNKTHFSFADEVQK